jgi:hypothetical protein
MVVRKLSPFGILHCRGSMKEEKFQKIVEEISEFIAGHAMGNPHYLFDEDIIKIFSHYKKKHVKRALEEIR